MYKVTDVCAPALQYTPAGSYKAVLCENTAFSVWLIKAKKKKSDGIPCLWLPDFCM